MKTSLLAAFVALGNFFSVHSQIIEWGEVQKRSASSEIILDEGTNFYTLSFQKTALYTNYDQLRIARYEKMVQVAEGKIKKSIGSNKGSVFGAEVFNGKLVVFLSETENNMERFYYQIYNTSCLPESEAVLVTEFEVEEKKRDRGYFQYTLSEDKKFMVLEYAKREKKTKTDKRAFKVLNSDLELVQEGEFEATSAHVKNSLLASNGDYLIGIGINKVNEKGREKSSLQSFRILHFSNGTVTTREVDFEEKAYYGFKFYAQGNVFVLFGAYYSKESVGYKASYYDIVKQEEIKSIVCTEQSKLQRPVIRDIFLDEDDGLVVLMEEYQEKMVTRQSSNGSITTSYNYYFNTACVIKMKHDGDPEWMAYIPKRQFSVNDGGILSSLSGYHKDGKYCLYFNDRVVNYDEKGAFNNPEKLEFGGYRKKKNVIAKVEIDLKDGTLSRNVFLKWEEKPLFAAPSYFAVDYLRQELVVYFLDRKSQQYGILEF